MLDKVLIFLAIALRKLLFEAFRFKVFKKRQKSKQQTT